MSNDYPPPGPGQDPAGDPNQPPPPPPAAPSYGQEPYGQQPYGQQPGQPPGFPPPGAPGAPGGYGQPQQTNPLAITSLVLGIVGFLCCTIFVLSIGAVVTGFLARKQINEQPGRYKGGGMATAGLVLGVISIVVAILYWILALSGAIDSNFYMQTS